MKFFRVCARQKHRPTKINNKFAETINKLPSRSVEISNSHVHDRILLKRKRTSVKVLLNTTRRERWFRQSIRDRSDVESFTYTTCHQASKYWSARQTNDDAVMPSNFVIYDLVMSKVATERMNLNDKHTFPHRYLVSHETSWTRTLTLRSLTRLCPFPPMLD